MSKDKNPSSMITGLFVSSEGRCNFFLSSGKNNNGPVFYLEAGGQRVMPDSLGDQKDAYGNPTKHYAADLLSIAKDHGSKSFEIRLRGEGPFPLGARKQDLQVPRYMIEPGSSSRRRLTLVEDSGQVRLLVGDVEQCVALRCIRYPSPTSFLVELTEKIHEAQPVWRRRGTSNTLPARVLDGSIYLDLEDFSSAFSDDVDSNVALFDLRVFESGNLVAPCVMVGDVEDMRETFHIRGVKVAKGKYFHRLKPYISRDGNLVVKYELRPVEITEQ